MLTENNIFRVEIKPKLYKVFAFKLKTCLSVNMFKDSFSFAWLKLAKEKLFNLILGSKMFINLKK